MPIERLQRDHPMPLWAQLEAELRRRLQAGEFADGAFPTDLELTRSYEVSRHTVREAVRQLPPKQQAAVLLRHLQGLDYIEIAQVLDCSQDSARANVYQGLRRLRHELADVHPWE